MLLQPRSQAQDAPAPFVLSQCLPIPLNTDNDIAQGARVHATAKKFLYLCSRSNEISKRLMYNDYLHWRLTIMRVMHGAKSGNFCRMSCGHHLPSFLLFKNEVNQSCKFQFTKFDRILKFYSINTILCNKIKKEDFIKIGAFKPSYCKSTSGFSKRPAYTQQRSLVKYHEKF